MTRSAARRANGNARYIANAIPARKVAREYPLIEATVMRFAHLATHRVTAFPNGDMASVTLWKFDLERLYDDVNWPYCMALLNRKVGAVKEMRVRG